MRPLLMLYTFGIILSVGVEAQQLQSASQPESPKPESVKLYNGYPRLVNAELLLPQNQSSTYNECKGRKEKGTVALSFIVDSTGQARNIVFEKVSGETIDYLAVEILKNDRFQPAKLDGDPVAVAAAITMGVEVCVEPETKPDGSRSNRLELRSQPEQKLQNLPQHHDEIVLAPIPDPQAVPTPPEKVGNGVTAPRVMNSPQAEFSDYAHEHNVQGTCTFSIVVDEHGLPQDIQIVTPMEPSLLEKAYETIRQYRFKPATKNGVPVRTQIKVEVNFKRN